MNIHVSRPNTKKRRLSVKRLAQTTAVALCLPLSATALPLADGIYDAFDFDGNRTVYGFSAIVGTGHLWSFQNDAALVVDNGGTTATLIGTIENLVNASLEMAVNISFTLVQGTRPGYCQFNLVQDPDCDSTYTQGLIADPNVDLDPTSWNYFDIDAGSVVTGLGALAGLSYDITDKTNSMHPAQVGVSANALTLGDNGMSFWFDWDKSAGSIDPVAFSARNDGAGDFNLNLADNPDPPVGEVPLPAAGWLLIAGIGGLAAARRRKS